MGVARTQVGIGNEVGKEVGSCIIQGLEVTLGSCSFSLVSSELPKDWKLGYLCAS